MSERASVELPLGPALGFLRQLWRVNHAIERLSSRMEWEFGVSAQQRLMLRCVGKFPGITAGQLASLLHVDAGTVSATLRRLENKGLLERRRTAQDRRRVSLGLTARGQRLAEPQLRTVEHALDCFVESIPPEELLAARSALNALAQLLESELEAPEPCRTLDEASDR
jgi:DNA-binding MarR family transcriptional regulator